MAYAKLHISRKEIERCYTTISVPYCSLQHLLNYEKPFAYTTRREGWGADVYVFDNTAIVTGYAPFGECRPSSELNKKYDDMAREQLRSYTASPDSLRTLIENYIEEAFNEVTNRKEAKAK